MPLEEVNLTYFFHKGCTKSGSKVRKNLCDFNGVYTKIIRQRFQSRLRGVKNNEDRMSICRTAPAIIRGIRIPKPTSCNDQVSHVRNFHCISTNVPQGIWGAYGVWDLEDQSC